MDAVVDSWGLAELYLQIQRWKSRNQIRKMCWANFQKGKRWFPEYVKNWQKAMWENVSTSKTSKRWLLLRFLQILNQGNDDGKLI